MSWKRFTATYRINGKLKAIDDQLSDNDNARIAELTRKVNNAEINIESYCKEIAALQHDIAVGHSMPTKGEVTSFRAYGEKPK